MSDSSRSVDFPAIESVTQEKNTESDKREMGNSVSDDPAARDGESIYIYTPLDDIARLNYVLKKTGRAFRINDYQACAWSDNHILCYFRYESLNSFQKLLLQDAKRQQVTVMPLMQYFEQYFGVIEIELLGPEHLLEMDAKPRALSSQRVSVRSWFERFCALVALVGFLPMGCVVALAIKLDSRGPVFFHQLRTGLYNREFEIVKFRSMAVNAEQDGARWATQDDDRITRVGSFLRKTRIDELPQLINVIRGEMSMIGPRPEREIFIRQLESKIPYYRFRHLVKPGITGLAQVMYGYGASIDDARQKHRYDLYYIKHQGWWLDLKILWKTLKIVITGKGV